MKVSAREADRGSALGTGVGLGSTAGGDTGGSFPAPTVVGIQGVPVDPSAGTPADRDALIYDAALAAWIADHVQAEDLATTETDTSLVLAPDGAGGVAFRAETGGGGGSSTGAFKRTVLNGTGNMTISTGRDEIDATKLGYLTLTLAVGDVVRCTIECQYYANSGTIAIYFDFEVDQPTSANTSIAAGQTGGLWETVNAGSRDSATPFGLFTATEAGVHGFRPWAWTSANTATIANGASGNDMTQVTFLVENLGQQAA